MSTDPRLTALRKPLKPLLAEVLTGEPWRQFDPCRADPVVYAASLVSYLSRRAYDWHTWSGPVLAGRVTRLLDEEAERPEYHPWPFLDALRLGTATICWSEVEAHLVRYRAVWCTATGATPPPAYSR